MLWRSSAPARSPPGFIEPCLPTLADAAPSGPQWVIEIKHDGGHDWTERVPAIARALAMLPVASVTLDGEGVACGPDRGHASRANAWTSLLI